MGLSGGFKYSSILKDRSLLRGLAGAAEGLFVPRGLVDGGASIADLDVLLGLAGGSSFLRSGLQGGERASTFRAWSVPPPLSCLGVTIGLLVLVGGERGGRASRLRTLPAPVLLAPLLVPLLGVTIASASCSLDKPIDLLPFPIGVEGTASDELFSLRLDFRPFTLVRSFSVENEEELSFKDFLGRR